MAKKISQERKQGDQFSRVNTMAVCPKIVIVGVMRSGCIWEICQR